jgi:RNA polymerase sigma-70 factor, ECF subfamily
MPSMTNLRSVPETSPRGGEGSAELDFDALYRTYAPRVSMWVRRLQGRGSHVEDIVHDVFCVALRRRADYDSSRGEYGAWLHGIAVRTVIAHRRRQQLTKFWSGMFTREQTLQHDDDSWASLDESIDVSRVRRRLYAWLDKLPESQRTVFVLFEMEELDGPAISALLNISLNNVWVRLHRARAALEKLAQKAGSYNEVTHAAK